MKIKVTNRLGLPNAFVKAIEADPYDPDDGGQKSDYTITGLLKPARMAELARTNEVTEDAADRLFSLQGQIIHGILERSKYELEREGFVVEKRFYKSYAVDGRIYVVSAKVDVFDPAAGRLSDYKYTSVGAAQKGLKDEHKWQVNFQAELIRSAGFSVDRADATILMRDWSAERQYMGYPSSPAMVHNVPLLSTEEIDTFVVGRIRAHEAAKVQLPQCSNEERWSRPTFAVMKEVNAPKAIRVYDSQKEADAFITAKGSGDVVVERPGKSIRCMRYCPVRSICSQAKEVLKEEVPLPEKDSDGFIKVN